MPSPISPLTPPATTVETVFNQLFLQSYNTVLLGGANEPLYLPAGHALTPVPQSKHPATQVSPHHQIFFREDYFSSALHEVAHWCLAGKARREQEDYGYWYEPDGRSSQQQALFEQVEIKPQALEWIFSVAASVPFRVSVDNLSGDAKPSSAFKASVVQQAQHWCHSPLPRRAQQFAQALSDSCWQANVSLSGHRHAADRQKFRHQQWYHEGML